MPGLIVCQEFNLCANVIFIVLCKVNTVCNLVGFCYLPRQHPDSLVKVALSQKFYEDIVATKITTEFLSGFLSALLNISVGI